MRYKPYVPQGVGEILEQLSYMMLASPTFEDKTGFLPGHNIETAFYSLNEGLLGIRKKVGEERYAALRALSDRMRALFETDPNDSTGNTQAAQMLIHEMRNILRSVTKRAKSK